MYPIHVSYRPRLRTISLVFFFNDTATTEIYTLSLHDALPIWLDLTCMCDIRIASETATFAESFVRVGIVRSEEHTSELQSQSNLVCRLLLEKKKTNNNTSQTGARQTGRTARSQ